MRQERIELRVKVGKIHITQKYPTSGAIFFPKIRIAQVRCMKLLPMIQKNRILDYLTRSREGEMPVEIPPA
jgi:hypothetical protein